MSQLRGSAPTSGSQDQLPGLVASSLRGYGLSVITVVTAIAAQMFDPHATSAICVGTYLSFTGVTEPDVTVASQGDDEPFMPPITQRSSDAQASDKIELRSEATLDHVLPRLSVRTIRQPVESFASPRHFFPAQFSEVSAAHVTVEKSVRGVQVVPPSEEV